MFDIFIAYKGEVKTLPVNPEELNIERPSNNDNAEVIGLGEINIIKKPKLMAISIESFFPEDDDPQEYIDYINEIYDAEEPCRIVNKEMELNMMCSIDNFEHSARAGEEGDRYYTLELQEWRDYSPKKVETSDSNKKPSKPSKKPAKRPEQPKKKTKTYKVKSGDCLWNIAKKYTGNGARWTELYKLNKAKIGSNPNLIYPGQVFNIPSGW